MNTFGGRAGDLFALAGRPRDAQAPATADAARLRIASVDIGGGTTDLVINDYRLDGDGRGAYIVPEQCFRDGFKVAGDDIVLDVIRTLLVPALEDALAAAAVPSPPALLSWLIGSEHLDVRQSVLRQQLALQVFYPAGLAILKRYEGYDPIAGADPSQPTLGELVSEVRAGEPTAEVLDWVREAVAADSGMAGGGLDLTAMPVPLDLNALHQHFLQPRTEITRVIKALCEVMHLYDCDLLLLTGRPSLLPGVQETFRALLPLTPERIVPLHHYRTGGWYPFHRRGRIEDPKTTAAVGAALCSRSQGGLPGFYLRAGALRPYSTVRILGVLDNRMVIADDQVIYREVNLDDPDYRFPDIGIPMRGPMRLGFRQLDSARWTASPLYLLELADEAQARRISGRGDVLEVRLERERSAAGAESERLRVAGVEVRGGHALNRDAVRLRLNTLTNVALDDDSYWLDSGSVYV
jgi:hypothetical protein